MVNTTKVRSEIIDNSLLDHIYIYIYSQWINEITYRVVGQFAQLYENHSHQLKEF
jgi:hypothetical protein